MGWQEGFPVEVPGQGFDRCVRINLKLKDGQEGVSRGREEGTVYAKTWRLNLVVCRCGVHPQCGSCRESVREGGHRGRWAGVLKGLKCPA